MIYVAYVNPFLTGLTKLESLNINMCHCITDADLKPLSGNFSVFFLILISCIIILGVCLGNGWEGIDCSPYSSVIWFLLRTLIDWTDMFLVHNCFEHIVGGVSFFPFFLSLAVWAFCSTGFLLGYAKSGYMHLCLCYC